MTHGITVEQPVNFRSDAAIERLQQYQADVMIVAAYGLILPQVILDSPRYGCINIHASLLPRWRGAAPIHRAILAGDTQTGITLMRMEAGLDTGPMLRSAAIDIDAHESTANLHDRLAALGASLVLPLLTELPECLQHASAQPESGVTYAKKILKEEARIDWQRSATQIDRQVRAFNPWPIAETTWCGKQLRVWQAHVVDAHSEASPGTVLHADINGIQVACSDKRLNIVQLQLAGRSVVSAAEFIKGHTLIGQTLGIR
jgi:methionyl-tRNA formyltransferase